MLNIDVFEDIYFLFAPNHNTFPPPPTARFKCLFQFCRSASSSGFGRSAFLKKAKKEKEEKKKKIW